jgi:hypothetical protein
MLAIDNIAIQDQDADAPKAQKKLGPGLLGPGKRPPAAQR